MPTKVTIQDIADSLGLSRTTVSKVLNHSPAVSDATRTMVLEKAKELNYRTLPQSAPTPAAAEPEQNYFALVMHAIPGGIHIGTAVIPGLDQQLRQAGYSLITCAISAEEYQELTLPPILRSPSIKAIVCMELFHPEYSQLLASLGKPIAFIDACVDFMDLGLNANLLLMDSRNSCRQMLTTLIRNHNVTSMGFVGDVNHCISFRERYESFLMVGKELGVDTSYRLLDHDLYYAEDGWLSRRLPEMGELPQLIFCANDFLASQTMFVLDSMGKRVPEDVMVCGFDGIYSMPPTLSRLTTISTPASQLGALAATTLLHKLMYQNDINSSTYLQTKIIYRESAPEC
ncbi:MAG: LacI family DNA-binding transcriptional regulator [Oscillospiraceae bacterium]|nr:LacI family DNA-binding transcriptional regulator [Oscillospiraceae bacterium]